MPVEDAPPVEQPEGQLNVVQDQAPQLDEAAQTLGDVAVDAAAPPGRRLELMSDKEEKWAGILRDHPVSEAYKEAHPKVDFEADADGRNGLASIDFFSERDLESIRLQELEAGRQSLADKIQGRVPSPFGEDRDMFCAPMVTRHFTELPIPEEDKNAWDEIVKNPAATLGQIQELYDKIYDQYVIGPQKRRANSMIAVLEDVKSGRASQQPEQPQN